MNFIPKRLRFFNRQMGDYDNGTTAWTPFVGTDEPRGPEGAEGGDDYNLIASISTDGLHHPVLDVDKDLGLRIVESSTPGHCHIYMDNIALPWDQYLRLLSALQFAGIVDPRWVDHSRRKGYSSVRPPHIKKKDKTDDAPTEATKPNAYESSLLPAYDDL